MKRKHSIRTRMTVIFSLVLTAALIACLLANTFFLENYYIRNKLTSLRETYEYLDSASAEEQLTSDDFVEELNAICEANTISLFVMGVDGKAKLTTVRDSAELRRELYEYVLGVDSDNARILEENDSYRVSVTADSPGGGYLKIV
ncbi:MAG: hypothetical protein LUC60_08400, partial [Lachnospiraceae bacterium]|nr:hypothetical protein [Lachnospiraceae bacterium]